jgi:hypothetical protein
VISNQRLSPLISVDIGSFRHVYAYGDLLALSECRKKKPVMRVSINDEATVATLKVEGRVVGPWATELGRTWHGLWASARQKRLRLDIRGVTFADQKGSRILQEIVRTTGAEIVADSPLTQYFASRVTADRVLDPEER